MLDLVRDLVAIPKSKIVPPSNLFGVEVEMEGANLLPTEYISPYWKVVPDGSLRGESQEYVLRAPLSYADTITAVETLYKDFTLGNSILEPSIRCGVHVHLNVQNLNLVQLMTLVSLYLMFEEVLCEYCGPNRVGNMFCLRTKDAEYFLTALREAARNNDLSGFNTDKLRYCSLNLKSLFKFGSIEFRTLSTPKTAASIVEWVSLINSLYLYSLTLKSPTEVLSLYSDRHEEYLLAEVFKSYTSALQVEDLKGKIKSGFRYARLLAKTVDWSSYFTEPKTKNPFHKVALITNKRSCILPKVTSRKYQSSHVNSRREDSVNRYREAAERVVSITRPNIVPPSIMDYNSFTAGWTPVEEEPSVPEQLYQSMPRVRPLAEPDTASTLYRSTRVNIPSAATSPPRPRRNPRR